METIFTILQRLKNDFGLIAIKAEFEAEGMTLDELALYADLASQANLDLTVKIGGPNAKRDFHEAWQIRASNILVPMVESRFALENLVAIYQSCDAVYQKTLNSRPKLLFNLESIEAIRNLNEIHQSALSYQKILKGVVIGRTDLASSMSALSVNTPEVCHAGKIIAEKFSQSNFDVTLGGGVNVESYQSLTDHFSPYIKAYETRKCTLAWSDDMPYSLFEESTKFALIFEKAWIQAILDYEAFNREPRMARLAQINSRLSSS